MIRAGTKKEHTRSFFSRCIYRIRSYIPATVTKFILSRDIQHEQRLKTDKDSQLTPHKEVSLNAFNFCGFAENPRIQQPSRILLALFLLAGYVTNNWQKRSNGCIYPEACDECWTTRAVAVTQSCSGTKQRGKKYMNEKCSNNATKGQQSTSFTLHEKKNRTKKIEVLFGHHC